jgi:hypothetical protein
MTAHHLATFRRLVFLIILTCRSRPLYAMRTSDRTLCRADPKGRYQACFRMRSSEPDNPALQPDYHRVRPILRTELGQDIADLALDGGFAG